MVIPTGIVHIGESVFALSAYENVAVFFNQRTTIESLRSALVMMSDAFSDRSSYQSGVKYRSFILEWLPYLRNDGRNGSTPLSFILIALKQSMGA